MDSKICEVCGASKFIDEHHYDCSEGRISADTIALCRRCHRTYHDRGIEWFDDEYLDKAIEIENRFRQLRYNNLDKPIKPLVLLRREDIRRSDYWNKIHRIKSKRKPRTETASEKQLGFDIIGNLLKTKREVGCD